MGQLSRKRSAKNLEKPYNARFRHHVERGIDMNTNTIVVNGVPINVDPSFLVGLLTHQGLASPIRSIPTFGEYAKQWFERFKRPKLRPKTILSYETMFKCHIMPFFKDMTIDQIRTSDIQSFFETMPELSRSTVKHMRDVLHQVFDSAIEDEYLERNPTNSTRLVLPEKVTERKALTAEEVRHILTQMSRLQGNDQLLLMLLIYTGERKGEVLGLRWEDIDFENDLIHVRRSVVNIRNEPTVGEPKTKVGVRDVPLLPELRAFLEACPNHMGYLLGGEKPFTESAYRRTYERISKRIDLHGATAHVFRHTFLTMAASSLDPKTLQAIAGHASCDITMNRYVHKRNDKVLESRQKLEGMFGQSCETSQKTEELKKLTDH